MKIEAYIRQRNRAVEQAVKLAESRGHIDTFLAKDVYLYLEDTLTYVNGLDEPQKPVIPQFVADYIESNKGWSEDRQEYIEDDSSGLWFALDGNSYGMPNSVSDWLFNEEKVETFAKAWLDGYEVEKEKLYYIMNHEMKTMLVKGLAGEIKYSSGHKLVEIKEHFLEEYQFTEAEIKSVDERYWAFAKPVEEVTE